MFRRQPEVLIIQGIFQTLLKFILSFGYSVFTIFSSVYSIFFGGQLLVVSIIGHLLDFVQHFSRLHHYTTKLQMMLHHYSRHFLQYFYFVSFVDFLLISTYRGSVIYHQCYKVSINVLFEGVQWLYFVMNRYGNLIRLFNTKKIQIN